jgi:hypothetical protein
MTKCEICNNKIEIVFLGKINGTYIKKDKKLKTVCCSCQKKFKNEISNKI